MYYLLIIPLNPLKFEKSITAFPIVDLLKVQLVITLQISFSSLNLFDYRRLDCRLKVNIECRHSYLGIIS